MELTDISAEFEQDNQDTYTRFGFIRQQHTAGKAGAYSNIWECQLTLTADSPVLNEIEAARDLEVLILQGAIPLYGKNWRLAHITFSWPLTKEERETFGANVKTLVRVGYKADVDIIGGEELAARMSVLGIEGNGLL